MNATPARPAAPVARPFSQERSVVFRAVPSAVSACRRFIRAGLFAHELLDLADDACAVTSELATNVVNATQAEWQADRLDSLPPVMAMNVGWTTAGVLIELWTTAPGLGTLAMDAEARRGLVIVEALTDGRWGWFSAGTGQCMWAEIVRSAEA